MLIERQISFSCGGAWTMCSFVKTPGAFQRCFPCFYFLGDPGVTASFSGMRQNLSTLFFDFEAVNCAGPVCDADGSDTSSRHAQKTRNSRVTSRVPVLLRLTF